MATLPRSGDDLRLAGERGTFRFDVTEAGSWRLHIADGHFVVLDGGGDADLVLSCDEQTFVRLVHGEQNFVTALLQGLVRADGNLALGLRFHGLLHEHQPSPSAIAPAEGHP